MIKANELRIGNWVIGSNKKPAKVKTIRDRSVTLLGSWATIYSKLEPIPITPEILEKCGGIGDDSKNDYKINDFWLKNWGDYKSWIVISADGYDVYPKMPLIKYLHQLQNLYFALTGNELEIEI